MQPMIRRLVAPMLGVLLAVASAAVQAQHMRKRIFHGMQELFGASDRSPHAQIVFQMREILHFVRPGNIVPMRTQSNEQAICGRIEQENADRMFRCSRQRQP